MGLTLVIKRKFFNIYWRPETDVNMAGICVMANPKRVGYPKKVGYPKRVGYPKTVRFW